MRKLLPLLSLALLCGCGGADLGSYKNPLNDPTNVGGRAVPPDHPVEFSRYLYVPSGEAHAVLGYRLVPDTGRLVPLGTTPLTTPGAPGASCVVGNFYYVADQQGSVSAFAIQSDGRLLSVQAPLALSGTPQLVALLAGDDALYALSSSPPALFSLVRDSNGAIAQNGSPVALAGPISATPGQSPLAFDGTYVYAADGTQVAVATVLADGSLSVAGTYPTAGQVDSLVVRGSHLYATNPQQNVISQFSTDGAGTLTPLTPATVATGSGPAALVADPGNSTYVFVANSGDLTVSSFVAAANGTLALAATLGDPNWTAISALEVDAQGLAVYVKAVTSQPVISHLPISSGAALGPLSDADSGQLDVAADLHFSATNVSVVPTPLAAYVVNHDSDNISTYFIESDGQLNFLGNVSTVTPAPSAAAVATLGSGARVLYVSEAQQGFLSSYAVNSDGSLDAGSALQTVSVANPVALAVDTSNRFLFELSRPTAGNSGVYVWQIAGDGSLTLVGNSPFSTGQPLANKLIVDARGGYLYVTHDSGPVVSLAISQSGQLSSQASSNLSHSSGGAFSHWYGTLVALDGMDSQEVPLQALHGGLNAGAAVAVDGNSQAVTFDLLGRHLYTAVGGASPHISRTDLNLNGTLSFSGAEYPLASAPRALAGELSGSYLYAAGSGGVFQFLVSSDGSLQAQPTSTVAAGTSPVDIVTVGDLR